MKNSTMLHMIKKLAFLLVGLHVSFACFSQSPSDIKAIDALIDSSIRYKDVNKPLMEKYYADSALSWSLRINYPSGILQGYNQQANAYLEQDKYEEVIDVLNKALKYRDRVKSKKDVASVINNLALAQSRLGDYTSSIKNNLKALELREKIGDKRDIIASLQNIGVVYHYIGDDNAIKVTWRAMAIASTLKDSLLIATLYDNLGGMYFNRYKDDSAFYCYMTAKRLYEKFGTGRNKASIYNNIAVYYNGTGQAEKSLRFLRTAWLNLDSAERNGIPGVDYNLTMGNCFKELKNKDSSLFYYKKAEWLARKLKFRYKVVAVYNYYVELYSAFGDYKSALDYSNQAVRLKDSLMNERSMEKIMEYETLYKTDKQAREIQLLNANNKLQEERSRSTSRMLWLVSIALLLTLGLVFLVYRNYQTKKKDNVLLNQKNTEINQKNLIIEEKQKEIIDSITYARRIQEAYLPPEKTFNHIFPDGFLLFMPKDLVSGDFYWFYTAPGEHGQPGPVVFFAVADCTGHGVPGALMSMICCNALNEVVVIQKITDPGQILGAAREIIIRNMKSETGSGQKDGMDIALCRLDRQSGQMWYAGANNPLWIIRENGNVFEEVKPDKQPVGLFEKHHDFTTHGLKLSTGDRVYVFSDGYADQFGGPKGKKFKYSNFAKLLSESVDFSMKDQGVLLAKKIEAWKGELEQVDDVCVIGIRI